MPRLGLGRNLSIPRRTGDAKTGAQYFNGTSTRVQLTNAMTLQDFTIMCWVKPNYLALGCLIDFRDTNGDGYTTRQTSSVSIGPNFNGGGKSVSMVVDGVWRHVAISRNSTTSACSFILNGVAIDSVTTGGTNSTTTPGVIGARSWGALAELYRGNLAQMAVFSTALSAAQVLAIMNKTYSQLTAGEKTNLVSWWALTNISGTNVPDLHGTNTGTLTP